MEIWNLSSSVHIDIEQVSAYLQASMYYSVYYINLLMTAFLTIFRRFPKIFQNCSEGQTNVPEHFPWISENSRRCSKISEDSRRLSRKIRRCFDDTPTNLSTIKETKFKYQRNYRYLHMWNYRNFTCENIWIFSVAEILIKHWCLYNKSYYKTTTLYR